MSALLRGPLPFSSDADQMHKKYAEVLLKSSIEIWESQLEWRKKTQSKMYIYIFRAIVI